MDHMYEFFLKYFHCLSALFFASLVNGTSKEINLSRSADSHPAGQNHATSYHSTSTQIKQYTY